MIKLPPSPKGPTVYVISEQAIDTTLHTLVQTGLGAIRADHCAIETILLGPTTNQQERGQIFEFLQDTYHARGAFIVGHASEFFDEANTAYDVVDPTCKTLGEVGVIARSPGQLRAIAPRLIAATRAANRTLPAATTEVLIFGAGPDARALAATLSRHMTNAKPAKVTLASTDATGLQVARQRLTADLPDGQLEIRHLDQPSEYDRQLALLPPNSAVVRALSPNEVDLGVSGSAALFPLDAVIWDLHNAASQSRFLAAAVPQRKAARLTLSDTRAYSTERSIADLEAMFGADADESDLVKLREAIVLGDA